METEGRRAEIAVAFDLPLSRATETDLLGNRFADAALQDGQLRIPCEPWKIRTMHVE